MLSIKLSCLVCWMDGISSFAGTFRVIFVLLTMRLLRFTKIRDWTLFLFFDNNPNFDSTSHRRAADIARMKTNLLKENMSIQFEGEP